MDSLLNFTDHITATTKKARSVAGMIIRNITLKSTDIMVPLYKALVRPILEYANSVWAPYLRKDIDEVENVQRHFTKVILGMQELSYEERLCRLRLPSLVYRRIRGDLIEVYKIIHRCTIP